MNTDRHSEFAREFTQNQAAIYGYIYSLLPRATDAEEVFGQASVVLWEKWDQFEEGTNFRAWARRIAYNVAMNYLRKCGRQERHLSDAALESLAADADVTDHWARVKALALCVDRLSPEQRRLIELCYMTGATVAGVAETLGKTTASVYKSRSRIRKDLRECVDRVMTEENVS